MIISNSEVTSYNMCERQHYYRFSLGIEPKAFSKALTRGIIGHEAWETYYRFLMSGASVDEAKEEATKVLQKAITEFTVANPEATQTIQALAELIPILDAYAEFYRVEPFKILAVEEAYAVPITDHIKYGLKLDLLIEYTKGEFRGRKVVMDHKFVYNFKTMALLNLDGQLPKYSRVMQILGTSVYTGVFNQIRYRMLKSGSPDDMFGRTFDIRPLKIEVDRIWEEQKQAAIEIAERKSLPVQTYGDKARRTLSPIVCERCPFDRICKAELRGEDVSTMLSTEFQPNSYGYNYLDSSSEN